MCITVLLNVNILVDFKLACNLSFQKDKKEETGPVRARPNIESVFNRV